MGKSQLSNLSYDGVRPQSVAVAAATEVTVVAAASGVAVGSVVVTVGAMAAAVAAEAIKWEDGEFSRSKGFTVYLGTFA